MTCLSDVEMIERFEDAILWALVEAEDVQESIILTSVEILGGNLRPLSDVADGALQAAEEVACLLVCATRELNADIFLTSRDAAVCVVKAADIAGLPVDQAALATVCGVVKADSVYGRSNTAGALQAICGVLDGAASISEEAFNSVRDALIGHDRGFSDFNDTVSLPIQAASAELGG